MDAQRRRKIILDELAGSGRVDVADLADRLETSVITIRRDLDQLATASLLRRVRGGAVTAARPAEGAPFGLRGEGLPFELRAGSDDGSKARMAAVVAGIVTDGEAVVIDSGTTGAAVAVALASRRITVMPLSLQGIAALADSTSVSLLLSGGSVRPAEGSIVGPLLERTLAGLRFDTAVLTCCGADPEIGVTAYDLMDAAAKCALRASAKRTILVAEGAKFSRTALAIVCSLESLDVVVTDEAAPANVVARLREAGLRVEIA